MINQQNTFIVQCPLRGSFSVPEEWTNLYSFPENIDTTANTEISVDCVIKLCELVKKMQK